MNNDELQVLGKPRKISKQEKWKIAIAAVVLLAMVVILGIVIHNSLSPQQPEKIRTEKKMGEPTIVPELQTAVDSLLNAQMIKIGNCLQGQVIVMEVETGPDSVRH